MIKKHDGKWKNNLVTNIYGEYPATGIDAFKIYYY